MKEKIHVAKNILLMFAILISFAVTISCSKSASYYVKQIDNFVDRGYPKPERISGTLVSDVKHEVVDGTAVIEDRANIQVVAGGLMSSATIGLVVLCDVTAQSNNVASWRRTLILL